jgi:hypothetical protein
MAERQGDDPLQRLRERIAATQEAAERLAGEATEARRTAGEGGVPPAGWATPSDRDAQREELQALAALLQALRDLVPPELQQQVTEVVRQVLLLIRAIIDWWVERLEGGQVAAPAEPAVEEIPID